MKILIDMNLSPAWAELLTREGFIAVHWSSIGDPRASDAVVKNSAIRLRARLSKRTDTEVNVDCATAEFRTA